MIILALRGGLEKYLKTHGLSAKFNKQRKLFEDNINHYQ